MSSMSIGENIDSQNETNMTHVYVNRDKKFHCCARGRAVSNFFSFIIGRNTSSSFTCQEHNAAANSFDLHLDIPTALSLSPMEEVIQCQDSNIKSNQNDENVPSSICVEMEQSSPPQEQVNDEDENKIILLNTSDEDQSKTTLELNNRFSRSQIENEIIKMVHNVLQFDKNKLYDLLYIADSHCYIDILFEQLHCPNQTIWSYVQHNRRLYENGIDMKYIIQSYFAPFHFYEEHPIVYGKCGLHPLFSHHYNLDMELNLRRCLSNPKVVAIGEIGLDYRSNILRPSKETQIEAFTQQIRLARSKNLPVIIYSRQSFIETLEILCK
ncbi:unnamed protein product, partial [Rotaria sp. Silwood1]